MLAAAVAMMLAAMLVELALPVFGALVGVDFTVDYFGADTVGLWLLALIVIVGIAAGSYPAFYLSAFEPAKVLKGDVVHGGAGAAFRNALVVGAVRDRDRAADRHGRGLSARRRLPARSTSGSRKSKSWCCAASAVDGLGPQWPAMKRS